MESGLTAKLAYLESLIIDVHWITIGQWQSCLNVPNIVMGSQGELVEARHCIPGGREAPAAEKQFAMSSPTLPSQPSQGELVGARHCVPGGREAPAADDMMPAPTQLKMKRYSFKWKQGHFHAIAVSTCDVASQTAPMYETSPEGAVTLTLAEAERLWAQKHEKLVQDFGGMLASQADQYENKLVQVSARLSTFQA